MLVLRIKIESWSADRKEVGPKAALGPHSVGEIVMFFINDVFDAPVSARFRRQFAADYCTWITNPRGLAAPCRRLFRLAAVAHCKSLWWYRGQSPKIPRLIRKSSNFPTKFSPVIVDQMHTRRRRRFKGGSLADNVLARGLPDRSRYRLNSSPLY